MKLSIDQAATRLGKTHRQVRYLIQKGKLPAEKIGGRWMVEIEQTDNKAPARQAAKQRQQRQFRAAFEDALELDAEARRPRFSVVDLKAFQIGSPLYEKASATLGNEHPATLALRRMLEHLTLGCHRYDNQEKAGSYREARDEASRAVCELALSRESAAPALQKVIEQELMAALAGLLRRLERRRRP